MRPEVIALPRIVILSSALPEAGTSGAPRLRHTKVCEYGEDSSVVTGRVVQAEFHCFRRAGARRGVGCPIVVEGLLWGVAIAAFAHDDPLAADSEARISGFTDGGLRVSVRDDGIGGADFTRGSGLVGLKDRVEALGGRISVESARGEGTTILVEVPLPEAEAIGSR